MISYPNVAWNWPHIWTDLAIVAAIIVLVVLISRWRRKR